MNLLVRAMAVCGLIVIVESIQGTRRQIFIAPWIGDLTARQLDAFSESALILGISWLTARWIGAKSFEEQLRAGLLWVVLIVLFELSLGRGLGCSWERILSDYDLAHGGLMGLGLVFLLFAPALGAKHRQEKCNPGECLLSANGADGRPHNQWAVGKGPKSPAPQEPSPQSIRPKPQTTEPARRLEPIDARCSSQPLLQAFRHLTAPPISAFDQLQMCYLRPS